ncbi:MAG: heavy-metal-associated domain-containing protein [Rubrobacter sp.]|jgi:copper chaperone CopZ|nr:heavy-metal-associated domain-containing protein [Rubrobacter sp.]
MPDITLIVKNLKNEDDAERLERALSRLDFVRLVSVDGGKGLAAVSYDGGESELSEMEAAIGEAGFEYEATPGARKMEG